MLYGWIMSVVGVITLGVLLDIMIPPGQTNKYLKGIFALVTLYVLIAPLPQLIDKGFSAETLFDFSAEIELDEDYLSAFSTSTDSRARRCEKNLAQNGIDGSVTIVEKVNDSAQIDYVNVVLSVGDKAGGGEHIDIANKAKSIIASTLEVSEEEVRVLWKKTE